MNILGESSDCQKQEEDSSKVDNTFEKIELRPRTNLTPGLFQEYKRTYVKVDLDSKDKLAQLVFREGFKIKDAAKLSGIKYATAKTIIFHLRREKSKKQEIGTRQCGFTFLGNKKSKMNIVSKTSQKIVSSVEHFLKNSNP